MTCPGLFDRELPPAILDPDKFRYLHNGEIIRHWFERGRQGARELDEDCFEPFVFSWIALNAWGECVTGRESDPDWVQDLARDSDLNRKFSDFVNDPSLKSEVDEFSRFWPIPKVQAWRRAGGRYPASKRPHDRARFFRGNGIQCEPRCALRHMDAGQDIPLDWLHFLPAVYRVRCNLFHGEKSPYDPDDVRIARASFLSLARFMDSLGWFP